VISAIRALLDRIGSKWVYMTVAVLADAHPAEVRFAELRRRMPGVSQKMLSQAVQSLACDPGPRITCLRLNGDALNTRRYRPAADRAVPN